MRQLSVPVAVVVAVAAMMVGSSTVSGQEHVDNGGFENGTAPWLLHNASASGCTSASGAGALRLAPPAGQAAFARQRIDGPLASGTYRLTGSVYRISGPASARVELAWEDIDGNVVESPGPVNLPVSASYQAFDIEFPTFPDAHSAVLAFSFASGSTPTTFCIDDVSIDGPPLATATPVPTDTPEPTPTSSLTPSASPAPSSTASPTLTATVTPTRTPQPGLGFRNGSFEDGADGWSKFGGELGVTDVPRMSGLRAGVLSSSTTSTKWAYQTVPVDPLQHYQFSGYLQPGAGVSAGLLRISWYATPDGTGEALSTSDSTASVAGGSAGYTWLTTGPVQPPASAKTARTRVLLTPASAAAASLFMDDLDFGAVQAATATAVATTPPTVAVATAVPMSSTSAPQRSGSSAAVVTTIPVTLEPTRVSEVSSTRVVSEPLPVSEVAGERHERPPANDDGVPLIWLIGVGAFVIGLGGAYVQGRRRT